MNILQKGIMYAAIIGVSAGAGYYLRDRASEKIDVKRCGVAVTEPVYGFPVIRDAQEKKYLLNMEEMTVKPLTKEVAKQKMKERIEELFK